MTRATEGRLLLRVVRPHAVPLVLTGILVAALVGGATALPRALAVSDDERLASAVDPATSTAAEIVLSARWSDSGGAGSIVPSLASAADDFEVVLRPPLDRAVGEARGNVLLAPVDLVRASSDGDPVALRLGTDPAALARATLREGALPEAWSGTGALPVALSESVATALGAAMGDVLVSDGLEMVVAGVVDPGQGTAVERGHEQGFADVTRERLQDGRSSITAGAWIDPASVDALDGFVFDAQLIAWYPVSGTGLRAEDLDALRSGIRAAVSAGAFLPGGQPLNVSSRLPSILDRVEQAQVDTSALVHLLAAGTSGAIVVALLIAIRSYADRRSSARRLLAARGAGRRRALRDGAAETALAAVPGAAIGFVGAIVLVPGATVVVDVAVAAAIALAVVGLGAVLALPIPSAWRGALRVGGDVLLLALGGTAGALLVTRGFAPSESGADPFLATAPVWIAVAAGVVVARILPWSLRALERARRRSAAAASHVAVAWAARKASAVVPIVAVVVAVAACVSSLIVAQGLSDALTAAARETVGGDARVGQAGDGVIRLDAIRAVAGVAAVEVRSAAEAGFTEDGRPRAADVLVTDTVALHEVRPDLPVLAPGEIAVSSALADAISGEVELGGGVVQPRVVAASLPVPDGRWVLVDERTELEVGAARSWVLCAWSADPPTDAPAMLREAAGPGATVLAAAEEREVLAARPAAVILAAVLLVGAVVPIVLGALAMAAAVAAAGPERGRLRGVLRLLGLPPRGGDLPAVWQVVPLVVLGSLAGGAVGVGVAVIVAGITDVAAVAGASAPSAAAAVPWPIVGVAAAGSATLLIVAGLIAAHPGVRRSRRATVGDGAA